MTIAEIRRKFLEFFVAKGYKSVEPSSLIPQNDPSVLFTTAGMQQFKDYYQKPDSAPAKTVTTVQPVIRTSDIVEVGDATHLTSFEMLGNFRFGESSSMQMKETAIKEAWEFVSQELRVDKDRVYATIFAGDNEIEQDTEAEGVWQSLGIAVKKAGRDDNFWGPTGDEGPCGPTSEIYIDGIEVWNLVFNQYYRDQAGKFTKLKNVGLDTGSGLERLAATIQGEASVWQIEPFKSWAAHVDPDREYESRVIIDHLRAIIFMISAGIAPANKGREYILRRLIRKTVFLATKLSRSFDWEVTLNYIRAHYAKIYDLSAVPELWEVIEAEKHLFERNLARATNHLERWLEQNPKADQKAVTELAFYMYESFGFPRELVIEYLISLGRAVDVQYFAKLFAQHQEVSRANLEGLFKGGLADHQPQTIKHHTAHHLLLAALQRVLGKEVVQKGSNITSERLRLDFNFDRKLTDDELKKVATIVNDKIKEDLPVTHQEMSKDEALKSGAQAEFGQKYGETVSVYSIGDFSKELCGGPHVTHTGELGKFEILKEEASSQGVRRIKARVK